MKDQIISLELAKLAKENGFDELCGSQFYLDNDLMETGDRHYTKNSRLAKSCTSAPTQSLLQKWLREVHDIHVYAFKYYGKYNWKVDDSSSTLGFSKENSYKETYEEALEAGLIFAIKSYLKNEEK